MVGLYAAILLAALLLGGGLWIFRRLLFCCIDRACGGSVEKDAPVELNTFSDRERMRQRLYDSSASNGKDGRAENFFKVEPPATGDGSENREGALSNSSFNTAVARKVI